MGVVKIAFAAPFLRFAMFALTAIGAACHVPLDREQSPLGSPVPARLRFLCRNGRNRADVLSPVDETNALEPGNVPCTLRRKKNLRKESTPVDWNSRSCRPTRHSKAAQRGYQVPSQQLNLSKRS
jgi:hypothetical protein